MMHNFYKSNKISGAIWLDNSINSLFIRIKIKTREGVVTFPKYNDSSMMLEDNKKEDTNLTEYAFKWQEKVFSQSEITEYSDINNCITGRDKDYNTVIVNENRKASKMFTFIHDDGILPKSNVILDKISEVSVSCVPHLKLEESLGLVDSNISSSTRHLFKSEQELDVGNRQWITMHILWDNSEYNEDSQLLYKDECILVSLYYNHLHNYLILSPNENDIEYNPYNVVAENGDLGIEYSVEIVNEKEDIGELLILLNRLNTKLDRKQKSVLDFTMPPLGMNKTIITFEIVSATDFEMDNIYIEYIIKIPDDMKSKSDVRGRTHVSKALTTEDTHEWKYGHAIDIELEYANGLDPLQHPLKIYLEVISTDWWGRHRTEGYSSLTLNMDPGSHTKYLSCSRPEELDIVEAESRRFFVGGCHLIKDLNVLDKPQEYDADFRYVTTGYITVRWTIMTQVYSGTLPSVPRSSASVLQGADDVLRQYNKAKATLAAATKDLDIHDYGKSLRKNK